MPEKIHPATNTAGHPKERSRVFRTDACRGLLETLATGAWLTPERLRVYPWIFLSVAVAVNILLSIGILWSGLGDRQGHALGADFPSFWAAARFAVSGTPSLAYDPARHHVEQGVALGLTWNDYIAFFYPPPFLLVLYPLGELSYLTALGAWMIATGAVCYEVLRRLARGSLPVIAALAFPAVALNAAHGQNAFLTTAVIGAGLLLQRAGRLGPAGLVFGILVFKPHLGIALPAMLLAERRWLSLAAALCSAILICGLAGLAFGFDIWNAYLGTLPLARASMEAGLVGFGKMQSVFAAVRLLGGSATLAHASQAASALGAFGLLFLLQAKAPGSLAMGPAAVTASLLATPFLLDYDLMLLSIPLVYLFGANRSGPNLPWERTVMAAAYGLPLVARVAATEFLIPLTPLVSGLLLLVVIRRGIADGIRKPTHNLHDVAASTPLRGLGV